MARGPLLVRRDARTIRKSGASSYMAPFFSLSLRRFHNIHPASFVVRFVARLYPCSRRSMFTFHPTVRFAPPMRRLRFFASVLCLASTVPWNASAQVKIEEFPLGPHTQNRETASFSKDGRLHPRQGHRRRRSRPGEGSRRLECREEKGRGRSRREETKCSRSQGRR